MARNKDNFFDSASSADEDSVIDGFDANDLSIPMGDDEEEQESDEEEEEEVQKPAPKVKKAKVAAKQEEEEEEDEEEEQEEEESEEDDDDEEEEEESDLSHYSKTALELIDNDVLLPVEGKDYSDSATGISDLVEDTVEQRLKQRIAPGYESIIEAMEAGVPAHEWLANATPVGFADADTTDEDTQIYLVTEKLKLDGLPKEKIQAKIERYKRLETLEEEAEEAVDVLVASEEKRNKQYAKELEDANKLQRQQEADRVKAIKETIENTNEIAGFYVSKTKKKELFDYMNKPINPKGQTQYMLDRNDPKKMVAIAFLAKEAVDSGKLEKVLSSKVAKKVKNELDANTATDKQTSGKGRQVKEKISGQGRMASGTPWDRPIEIEE